MVMFSDESRYNVDHHDGRIRVWRRPGAPHDRLGGGSGPVFGVQGEQI